MGNTITYEYDLVGNRLQKDGSMAPSPSAEPSPSPTEPTPQPSPTPTTPPPSPTPTCTPTPVTGLQFDATPVAGFSYAQGFGATQFARDSCQGECNASAHTPAGCQYRRIRGLHNGLDLSVPNGTPIYWTGNVDGVVVSRWAGDASENVVVEAGGYDVVFGHLSSRVDFEEGAPIFYGTQLGTTGSKHLHMGVRAGGKYYNPLYFFAPEVASTIETKMGAYSEGENAWSMRAYTYSSCGECGDYYWGAQPDRTGIER